MELNITRELEEIIVRHNIDSEFPGYRDYLAAREIAREFFARYAPGSKIMLLGTRNTDIDFAFEHVPRCVKVKRVKHDCAEDSEIDKSLFSVNYDAVVVVSYHGMKELAHELTLGGIRFVCLYEFFATQGLRLRDDFYNVLGAAYYEYVEGKRTHNYYYFHASYEIYYEKKRYNSDICAELKRYYLKRLIFIFLHIKDFVSAGRYMDEYISLGYAGAEDIDHANREISELLGKIKARLSSKTSRDGVIFWLDSLEKGSEKYMPFLNGLKGNTVLFENAFTVTPYTHPTMQTILRCKKTVDDKTYETKTVSEENSLFISTLEENGIGFISLHTDKTIDVNHRTKAPLLAHTPTATYFWHAVEELLNNDGNVFVLTCENTESHPQHMSPDNEGDRLLHTGVLRGANAAAAKKQYEESLGYADKQLEFYCGLLPREMTKIFMGDHGLHGFKRFTPFLKLSDMAVYVDIREVLEEKGIPCDNQYLWRYRLSAEDIEYAYNNYDIKRT